ncbi:MAG TPA: demethoxyubiquinone hydroxylase family protein [Armatimonadota bacterium]|nr:demethoxyubiquinone hydroxylase family protein [Armatimonadota bacterium]
MDFTEPFVGMARRTLTDAELAQAIRLDMAAELDAINLYQAHLDATDNPVARRVIAHIMDEEKEHLVEFAQLLYQLDPTQADHAAQAAREFADAAASDAPPAAEAGAAPRGLTVGSLKT